MYRLRVLENYFLCFFLFGQSSYISFEPKKKVISYLSCIPRTIYFLYTVCLAVIIHRQTQILDSITIDYINYTVIILHTIAISDSIICSGVVKRILISLNHAVNHLEMVLYISVRLDHFVKSYRQKLIFVVVLIQLSSVAKLSIQSPTFNRSFDIYNAIAALLKVFVSFHIILFVDFIAFLIWSMNNQLIGGNIFECSSVMKSNKIIRILRNVKTVHFKLWEITRHIDKRFGRLLLLLYLETLYTTVFAVSGALQTFWTSGLHIILIRKNCLYLKTYM